MAILESTIAPGSDAYKANREGMLALISRMRALEERTRAASGAAKDRFHRRGQLLPRERVARDCRREAAEHERALAADDHDNCISGRARA